MGQKKIMSASAQINHGIIPGHCFDARDMVSQAVIRNDGT